MEQIKKEIRLIPVSDIKPYEGSHNTDAVIEALKQSISLYGVQQPISVDKDYVIVTGNAVYRAAVALGHTEIPCVVLDDLTDEQIAQYRIADNKTSEFAKWNEEKLKKELTYIQKPDELQFCFDENLQAMIGNVEVKQIKAPTAKQEQKAEANFKDAVKSTENSMAAKPTEYFSYTCSKCGKKVTVKLQ